MEILPTESNILNTHGPGMFQIHFTHSQTWRCTLCRMNQANSKWQERREWVVTPSPISDTGGEKWLFPERFASTLSHWTPAGAHLFHLAFPKTWNEQLKPRSCFLHEWSNSSWNILLKHENYWLSGILGSLLLLLAHKQRWTQLEIVRSCTTFFTLIEFTL